MIICGIALLVEMALVLGWTGIDKRFLIDLAAYWLTAVALIVSIAMYFVL